MSRIDNDDLARIVANRDMLSVDKELDRCIHRNNQMWKAYEILRDFVATFVVA